MAWVWPYHMVCEFTMRRCMRMHARGAGPGCMWQAWAGR